jgi:hypothetical protein
LESRNIPGERIYIGISSIKERSLADAKCLAIAVFDYSDNCWSFFLKTKSDLKTKIIDLLTHLKVSEIKAQYIRCDDAVEIRSIKDDLDVKRFVVKFEFSGRRTPQGIRKIERKFQTFHGSICSILNGTGLNDELRSKIRAGRAMTSTNLLDIIAAKYGNKFSYELFLGVNRSLI